MPNCIETVEVFLATTAIGAIWSSCSPDFGINGVVERFLQIKPKILFITDKYFYNGKEINILQRLPKILEKIKSIQYVVLLIIQERNIYQVNINLKKLKFLDGMNLKKLKLQKLNFQNLILKKN